MTIVMLTKEPCIVFFVCCYNFSSPAFQRPLLHLTTIEVDAIHVQVSDNRKTTSSSFSVFLPTAFFYSLSKFFLFSSFVYSILPPHPSNESTYVYLIWWKYCKHQQENFVWQKTDKNQCLPIAHKCIASQLALDEWSTSLWLSSFSRCQ